jgi:hypothetical protein
VSPSALGKATGKGARWRSFCRVLVRRTFGKGSVAVTNHRDNNFSLPSTLRHLTNIFAECPIKSTRQRSLCRCTVRRAFFAECNTRQSLRRVFSRLCRVLQTLSKEADSDSALRCLWTMADILDSTECFGRLGQPILRCLERILSFSLYFYHVRS